MALTDAEILDQNPWWADDAWRVRDPHLRRLDAQPVRLVAGLPAGLDLESSAVHVLRGPRQVGKSTDLKLLVERALAERRDPRSVVYLALDLLEGQNFAELARTVRRAKELAGDGRALLLLDEVTSVTGWQTAVKALWDEGSIDTDVVICTGSSAIDLRHGTAERLPGRRGAGTDHLVLPQSFAAFARAIDASIPAAPGLSIDALRSEAGTALLHDVRLHQPALQRAFERYLVFGGLPAAVAEAANGAREPSPAIRRVVYDSLVRELTARGASLPAAHALLERIVRSLGSKTNWSTMAREMGVPLGRRSSGSASHHTLRDYVELLTDGYFAFVAYFWRAGSDTNELSRDKKLFFGDPLLHTVALDHAPGLQGNAPALVENAVGLALLRSCEPADLLIESFSQPQRLHIWQTARGGEIDFVCGPRDRLAVVEVKYQSHPRLSAASAAARAHPRRPVVLATKDEFAVRDDYSLVPAATLLWALG
jgi:uncharacterized protein